MEDWLEGRQVRLSAPPRTICVMVYEHGGDFILHSVAGILVRRLEVWGMSQLRNNKDSLLYFFKASINDRIPSQVGNF